MLAMQQALMTEKLRLPALSFSQAPRAPSTLFQAVSNWLFPRPACSPAQDAPSADGIIHVYAHSIKQSAYQAPGLVIP
jgi:hypothetical protein